MGLSGLGKLWWSIIVFGSRCRYVGRSSEVSDRVLVQRDGFSWILAKVMAL